MALSFTTNQAGASADYLKYLGGKPVKTDRKNTSDLFDFTLIPFGGSFVKLNRGTRIVYDTVTYPNWFTGYITNDPQLEYLGSKDGEAKYGYKYEATDDSYILNLKSLGLFKPFLNTTAGQLLKNLLKVVDPDGVFSTTGIVDGQKIARYVIDPNTTFGDVAKELADMGAFRFRVSDNAITFEAADTTAATISVDGNSTHFSPKRLSVQASIEPIVNDVVVLGGLEPQNYVNEYFLGDGFTAQFPLLAGVYGADEAVLLQPEYTTFDPAEWTEVDKVTDYIRGQDGFLNVLGGSVDGSLDVYLESVKLIPLEGHLRLTHGQFDFVDSAGNNVNGIIAGLWTQTPSSALTGCVYGVRVNQVASVTKLEPIINGVVDTSQSVTIDFTKRYVIRTLMNSDLFSRYSTEYPFLNADGTRGSLVGTNIAGEADFHTQIVEIDPSDGSIVATTEWGNNGVALASTDKFANYYPVVSNDLHCTLTGTTISNPIIALLEIKPDGGSFEQKIIGVNEIDSLDGLAPIATILSDGSGQSTNNALGANKFRIGSSTLAFFKDSTNQESFVPQKGDLIHIAYRRAGMSVGRAQDVSRVETEAAAWGDSGLRTIVKKDLKPSPRTSEEAELAAAAIVKELGYQHFTGTYIQFHPYEFTGEPVSGTVLSFANMPSSFPTSLEAELIHEVKTTMHAGNDRELFEHAVQFGKRDQVAKALAKFGRNLDTQINTDEVKFPEYVDVEAIGLVNAPDVVRPIFTGHTLADLNFDTQKVAPSGGGFEVRLTDEGWGVDDGKNLVTRVAIGNSTFSVPRTAHGKTAFIREYIITNRIKHSENITASIWQKGTGAVAVLESVTDVNKVTSLASKVSFSGASNRTVDQVTGQTATSRSFSLSFEVKGPIGESMGVFLKNDADTETAASTTVVFTGKWQRVHLSGTFSGTPLDTVRVQFEGDDTTSFDVHIHRVNFQNDRLTNTKYFKTLSIFHGATSRYSTAIRVNYPLTPDAPTGTVNYDDEANPTITVDLPASLRDVWGVEVRASNDTTVLDSTALVDAGFSIQVVDEGNTTRALSYFLYTFNLLGEYSASFNLTDTIPVPAIAVAPAMAVDGPSMILNWTGENTPTGYRVEVSRDVGFTDISIDENVTDPMMQLPDEDFFAERWIRVTPFDTISDGTVSSVLNHLYSPTGLVGFDNVDNVDSVPVTPVGADAAPTGPLAGHPDSTQDIIERSRLDRIVGSQTL